MSVTTTRAKPGTVLRALTVMPVLRWLIVHHSTEAGQPWRTHCQCGQPLWPNASRPSGKCSACSAPVGPRAYLMEGAALAAAVVIGVCTPPGWEMAAYLWWAAGALVLAFTDLAVLRLPHRLTAATTIGFLGLLAMAGQPGAWWRAVIAGGALAGFFTIIAVLSRGQLGWGDVAVAFPVGAALGWHSWAVVTTGTLLGLGGAAVIAIGMRLAGRLPTGTHLPIGPILLAGALAGGLLA